MSMSSQASLGSIDAEHSDFGKRTVNKVLWKILPILILSYFIAFLDRVNVGFAATSMNKDLGFTAAVYGIGAGIFFVGYFLFEIPSNLALHRYGARIWIARIMVTWGIFSGAMAFVVGEYSFFVIRFLLGAAEAGFFPGVVFYLTLWLPARDRAKVLGILYLAIPIAVVFGSVISSPLLLLDGTLGLKGWQWLFLIEAVPAVVLGVTVFFYLKDSPSKADWLTMEEKNWLTTAIERDRTGTVEGTKHSLWQVLSNPSVLKFSAIYFCMNFAGVGLVLFLPQIVTGFGATPLWAGVITAVPYAFAGLLLPLVGRLSDRYPQTRAIHAALAALLVAVSLSLALTSSHPAISLALIAIAALNIYAFALPFWALSSNFFKGAAAAAAIAAINSIGNLSGFVSPYVMGWLRDSTGSFAMSLLIISIGPAIAAISLFAIGRSSR